MNTRNKRDPLAFALSTLLLSSVALPAFAGDMCSTGWIEIIEKNSYGGSSSNGLASWACGFSNEAQADGSIAMGTRNIGAAGNATAMGGEFNHQVQQLGGAL